MKYDGPETLAAEPIQNFRVDEIANYSIMSIPSRSDITGLQTTFSEFDPDPDRIVLFPRFEATWETARGVIYDAAQDITPSYLFTQPVGSLELPSQRVFAYTLEPKSVVDSIHAVLADEVRKRKTFSQAMRVYGFEPHYMSGEQVDGIGEVYLGSLALIRHTEQGTGQIIAIAQLLDQDEEAA